MSGEHGAQEVDARPTTVRGNVWLPIAWTALSAGVLAAGLWLTFSRDVFGGAVFTHIWSSAFLLLVGTLATLLSVGSVRSRVRVFPDRLEATFNLQRTYTIGPGELARIVPLGKGYDDVRGVTARRHRGFTSNRFHRNYDVLADWLERNAAEPWAAYQDYLGKLTHQKRARPVYDGLMMLAMVGFFIATLMIFPGLFVGVAYDNAHKEQVTCTITAAEPITVSNRSSKGIGSSHPAVSIDTSDCGQLTLDRGVYSDTRDAIARKYDQAPGPYTFTVGGWSFWIRQNTPWLRIGPTVYSIDEPS